MRQGRKMPIGLDFHFLPQVRVRQARLVADVFDAMRNITPEICPCNFQTIQGLNYERLLSRIISKPQTKYYPYILLNLSSHIRVKYIRSHYLKTTQRCDCESYYDSLMWPNNNICDFWLNLCHMESIQQPQVSPKVFHIDVKNNVTSYKLIPCRRILVIL